MPAARSSSKPLLVRVQSSPAPAVVARAQSTPVTSVLKWILSVQPLMSSGTVTLTQPCQWSPAWVSTSYSSPSHTLSVTSVVVVPSPPPSQNRKSLKSREIILGEAPLKWTMIPISNTVPDSRTSSKPLEVRVQVVPDPAAVAKEDSILVTAASNLTRTTQPLTSSGTVMMILPCH